MANDGTVATWHTRPSGDDGMGDAHAPMSTVKVQDHSLEDVAGAFSAAGFSVAARSLQLEDFLPVDPGNRHYPRIVDLIRYYTIDKVLFRFTRG